MRRMIEIPLYERFLIRLNRFLAYKKSWTRSTFAASTFALFVRDSINNESYSRKEISIVCVFSVRGRCVSRQKNPMEIKCSYSAKSSWAFCAIAIKSAVWKPTFIRYIEKTVVWKPTFRCCSWFWFLFVILLWIWFLTFNYARNTLLILEFVIVFSLSSAAKYTLFFFLIWYRFTTLFMPKIVKL